MKNLVCQSQPLIAVKSVSKSSKFYQSILQCKSGHGGDEHEQLVIGERIILQLHAWDVAHHHEDFLGNPKNKTRGNGTILWFIVDDFEKSVKAIKKHKAKILKPVSVNENANHREIWFYDLDGYVVVIASQYDDL